MSSAAINIGVIGLGRAFTLMLQTFQDKRVKLIAATDPLPEARAQFSKDFSAITYESAEELCTNPLVDVVYIASPHQFHADHACLASSCGKHVLVEKPMALTLDECTRMIEAAKKANKHLIVGHSHSFNTPIKRARQLIDSGELGEVKMIHAFNFTDFLYRPRRPEELRTQEGGGVIHSQATHQIDIIRLLGGGMVKTVQAHTGMWDKSRPTEGAYSALLGFEGGAFASATYSGYGHFDSDLLLENIGEMGQRKVPGDYGLARRRLLVNRDGREEANLKAARNYGGKLYQTPATTSQFSHQHFGNFIVSCEGGDLRPTATGIEIFTDYEYKVEPLAPPDIPRKEVIDELVDAVLHGVAPVHNGVWARATTEVCLKLLSSAESGAIETLAYQAPTQTPYQPLLHQ
ncbi:MAG: Gfo/Idh/MocA family oxidoreductase [Polaromonas sp.]|uniref:Gfo/Idh/MocA family protein n=1 Tax=Polaromonas sp. TaxID=1869339 RepID=UPI0025E83C08|nr:Gfo/Idh/MocA family oxidoreductase [Polaromonas sp.]MBI2726271.1 Gfo/Idh/MocA family oxidoreductase [Polaromonas sp.]